MFQLDLRALAGDDGEGAAHEFWPKLCEADKDRYRIRAALMREQENFQYANSFKNVPASIQPVLREYFKNYCEEAIEQTKHEVEKGIGDGNLEHLLSNWKGP